MCTCPSYPPNHFFLLATVSSFSKSVSLFLFCMQVYLYRLVWYSTYKGCHMTFLLHWVHSVGHSPGPSMLLHGFILFNGWAIFHYIYVHVIPHLLHPFLCQWTCRLPPCLDYYKQCYSEHWGVCVLLNKSGIVGSSENRSFFNSIHKNKLKMD